jgi:transcriptional regulator with XRE-family HTH domain
MEEQLNKPELLSADIQIIVAKNLSKLRDFYGINQIDMAGKIKTYQAAYSLSEQGIRELNYTNLYHLAVELGINLNWLFGLSDIRLDPISRKKHIDNLAKRDKRKRSFGKKKK